MSRRVLGRQLLKEWFPTTVTPFVANGPMLGHADGILAAAVSKAGGLGHIAGVLDTSKPESLDPLLDNLRKARQALSIPEDERLPIGVGFLTFHASASKLANTIAPLIQLHKPAAIWLFAPSDPSPHAKLIPAIKNLDKGLRLIVQVGNVAAARDAAKHGADIIVAQGVDAGGHQWAQGAGIISLVPEIADMLATEFANRQVALLAAGGIMDGRGAAAALTLGADGVVLGTRYVASEECPIKDSVKQVYVETSDGGVSTVKSAQHDDVRGTGYWPSVYDGRAIITNSYRDLKSGQSMEEVQKRFKEAAAGGDATSRAVIWSGTGIGLIKDIKSAADITREIQQDSTRILREAARL